MSQHAQLLQDAGLDALWVTRPEHVRLLSGFTSPEYAQLLITPEGGTLFTNPMYDLEAKRSSRLPHVILKPPREEATREKHRLLGERLAGGRLGFEADHLTVAEHQALQAVNAQLISTTELLEPLRLRKDQPALETIRAAQRIADEAYQEVLPTIQPGRREQDVALDLENAMRRRGAHGPAFATIVASGEQGAEPHAGATDKEIRDGELVTIDMGARLDGYHSDMTRTIAVGTPGERLRQLYRAVLEAEEACLAAVKPGVVAGDLDRLARDILARHDLVEYFIHSLGHGIGLAVHEGPALRAGSEQVLTEGMVITIEPGVYLPGVGGVRIEDLVVVTADGYELLSTSPKDTL